MALTQNTVRMELPNGDVYEALGNVRFEERQQTQYVLDGLGSVGAIANAGLGQSTTAKPRVGVGAGTRTFIVRFDSWEGDTSEWGGLTAGRHAAAKAQHLGDALASVRFSSDNTATLSYGEYSSGGDLSPLSVTLGEADLPYDTTEGTSTFTGNITWVETLNVDQLVHEAP